MKLTEILKEIQPNEIGEQGVAAGTLKLLKNKKLDDSITSLSKFFNVTDDVVKAAYAAERSTLLTQLKSSINKDIKNGFVGNGQQLGELGKLASQKLAMKDILSLGRAVDETSMLQIINKAKNESRTLALSLEKKALIPKIPKPPKGPGPGPGAGAAASGGMTAAIKKGFARMGEIMTKIRTGIPWKKLVAWAAGLGITAYALWYLINEYGEGEKPSDMPSEAPSDWSPCVQNMVDSREGRVVKLTNGLTAVEVKNSEYPDGVYFYSNGRVVNKATKQMGSWTCKNGQTELQEVKRMSLMSLVEQTNEVTGDEMGKYLDDAIDDLDGWVAVYNINSLLNIVKNLKGKTYNGKDAFKHFLGLYLADDGENFIDDVNSIGVTTLGREGIEGKTELIALINGKSSSSTPSGSGGFDNVNITWDGQPTPDGGGTTPSPGQGYFSCEDWDIYTKPYIMGCKATKIREIQKCIGLQPDGMYGPKTRAALSDIEANTGNGISGEVYDSIMRKCKGESTQEPVTPPSEQPTATPTATPTQPTATPTDSSEPELGDTTYSEEQETGEAFYTRLLNGGYIFGTTDKNRIKFKYFTLSPSDFNKLNEFLVSKGYYLMKEKEKGDDKTKYVWEKSRRD
jgi:hypothetical protein